MQAATTVVNRQDISMHFTSKKGMHEFLSVENEFFLPLLHYTNVDWLGAIWRGEKKVS